ncbi:MAG: hypothetical protein ACK5HY_10370, partial [Parahaliea sp.]
MPSQPIYRLRQLAALLATASGLWRVACLWMGQLDESALLGALAGAVYLLMALGLIGHSRFTLFVAIAVPAASLWFGDTLAAFRNEGG